MMLSLFIACAQPLSISCCFFDVLAAGLRSLLLPIGAPVLLRSLTPYVRRSPDSARIAVRVVAYGRVRSRHELATHEKLGALRDHVKLPLILACFALVVDTLPPCHTREYPIDQAEFVRVVRRILQLPHRLAFGVDWCGSP
jgi:hypothetical protein